jgi:hypothetical protein
MNGLILEEAIKLKQEKRKFNTLRDEHLFSLVCFKYFYNKGEINVTDFNNIFVDGKDDGGIDLVNIFDDGTDQPVLLLIQSKNENDLANYNNILEVFRKMSLTYQNFLKGITSNYNEKLKRTLKDKLSLIQDDSYTVNLVCFHNSKISEDRMNKIKEQIELDESLESYNCQIFDQDDIIHQINSVKNPKRFVDEFQINVSKKDGAIKYGENGLLVNISSESIREMYDRFKDRGLFEQNFRYYIKHKKIDDNILKSLSSRRDDFWFLNNGIIIGCKDFTFDNNNVKVYNFSIINGCQTATLIGNYSGHNQNQNFYIPCKFVKPNNGSTIEEFENFISEIAESSNSQKPISERDLKSNRQEQKQLKLKLIREEPKIYLEIKRGEKRVRTQNPWQTIVNDFYGQLVLSFFCQQPGTARSSKKRIFSDDITYGKIFKRNIDKDSIVDLLKLNQFYTEFLEGKENSDKPYTTATQENIASNGRLVILAIIAFFVKYKRGLIDIKNIQNDDQWKNTVLNDNINGRIFSNNLNDDFQIILNSFFMAIILELESVYNEEKYKTVSNFFKVDNFYYKDILHHFKNRFIDLELNKRELIKYLEIFE